jgi:hypothetical protein
MSKSLACVLGALALAALTAPAALADGDPASDVLITQPIFPTYSPKLNSSQAEQFSRLVASAEKAGYPIKVAVIGTRPDLGSVPVLYRNPSRYARFLGLELYYWFKGEVLVAMPNGFGIFRSSGVPAADARIVKSLPAPNTTDPNVLIQDSMSAVTQLANQHGIKVSAKAPGSHSSSSDRVELLLVLVVVAALAGIVFLVRGLRRRAAR